MSFVESMSSSSIDMVGSVDSRLENAARSTRLEASLILVLRLSRSLEGTVSNKKPCILEQTALITDCESNEKQRAKRSDNGSFSRKRNICLQGSPPRLK